MMNNCLNSAEDLVALAFDLEVKTAIENAKGRGTSRAQELEYFLQGNF